MRTGGCRGMTHWRTDDELFDLARWELFPAPVGDVMGVMGLRHLGHHVAIRGGPHEGTGRS